MAEINASLTSLFSMSNLAPHSSFAAEATAFASSNSFSKAAMSDCRTSTFRLRNAGLLRMSSDDALVSSGIPPSAAAAPSSPAAAAAARSGDDARHRCSGGDDVVAIIVERGDGGARRKASKEVSTDERMNSRIMVDWFLEE